MPEDKPKKTIAGPLVLMILDGWGCREAADDNAISMAATPCWDGLLRSASHTRISTSGRSVGLPDGQMGNSEVGHMNIGAGRVVYQDYSRINQAIEDGSFFENPALREAIEASRRNGATLHIMGLLSPGGVHSHQDHFLAMLEMAVAQGAPAVRIHAFLDGRDTPPRSADESLRKMQAQLDKTASASYGSLCGRYYAMDRDRRWERVEQAWNMLARADCHYRCPTAAAGLQAAYDRGENDEFVSPTVLGDYQGIADGDAVVFINFRADRARELSRAFTEPGFSEFPCRRPALAAFVCMTQYLEALPAAVAFPPEHLKGLLGEVLSQQGLRQLRIAETEKYAHVTFFFNGGEEEPFPGEQRLLIPSPSVATYDLQPRMSIEELTSELDRAIRGGRFDVIVCNVANPDMVGHTGSLPAAIEAAEAVDQCLGTVLKAVRESGGELLITADHGNLEQMADPASGQPMTAHTSNPVPLVYWGRKAELESGGALKDIAPTMLDLLGLEAPAEMTGHSLVRLDTAATGQG